MFYDDICMAFPDEKTELYIGEAMCEIFLNKLQYLVQENKMKKMKKMIGTWIICWLQIFGGLVGIVSLGLIHPFWHIDFANYYYLERSKGK